MAVASGCNFKNSPILGDSTGKVARLLLLHGILHQFLGAGLHLDHQG